MSEHAPSDTPAARSRRRPSVSDAVFLVPVVAAVLLAIAFVRTMSHDAERLSGSNSVKLQQPVVQVGGGGQVCQQTLVPADTASVLLFVAPTGETGPPLTLTLADGKREVARGHIEAGWVGGLARFDVGHVRTTLPSANLCLRNEGKDPLAISGLPSELVTVTVDGKPQHAALTVQFYRPGTSTWWAMLPTVAHRAGVLKGSLAGAWGFWVALGLVGLAGAVSLVLVVRGWRS